MSALTWMYGWGFRAAWVLAAVSVPYFIYAAIVTVPATQVIAQEQRQVQIDRENLSFCGKHGMPTGTPEYTLCAQDLMNIRANEDQRTADEVRNAF